MTENEHQILVMCWAKKMALAGRAELDLLFHIPNGGGRSKREAGLLKMMGVKPGVSDLFLPVPKDGFHGLWVEMKTDDGRLSEEQKKWMASMHGQSYLAVVCFSWDVAVEAVMNYLGGTWPEVDMSAMVERLTGGV